LLKICSKHSQIKPTGSVDEDGARISGNDPSGPCPAGIRGQRTAIGMSRAEQPRLDTVRVLVVVVPLTPRSPLPSTTLTEIQADK
jgi:hypothetical protein